jgi:hypothetical protein
MPIKSNFGLASPKTDVRQKAILSGSKAMIAATLICKMSRKLLKNMLKYAIMISSLFDRLAVLYLVKYLSSLIDRWSHNPNKHYMSSGQPKGLAINCLLAR